MNNLELAGVEGEEDILLVTTFSVNGHSAPGSSKQMCCCVACCVVSLCVVQWWAPLYYILGNQEVFEANFGMISI